MKLFDREHLSGRFTYALMGAILFTAVGHTLPDLYYKYVDPTIYYSIEQPVSTDKKFYKPCEEVKVTIKRKALVDTTGSSVVDLLLIRQDNVTEKVTSINRSMAIPKGDRTLIVNWNLPCDLVDGKYYWQAVVKFDVRHVEKNYSYFSETFNVTQSGLSQTDEKRIDDKIEESQ